MARLVIHDVASTWDCKGGRPWQPGDLWMIVVASFYRPGNAPTDVIFLLEEVEIRDMYDRAYPVHWEEYEACGAEVPPAIALLTREEWALDTTLIFPIPSSIIEAGAPVHLRWDAIAADGSSIERLEIEFVPPLPPSQGTPTPSPEG